MFLKSKPASQQTNEEPTAVSRCFWDGHHQDVWLSDPQCRHDRWATMVQAAMLWYPLPSYPKYQPVRYRAGIWQPSRHSLLQRNPESAYQASTLFSAEAYQRLLPTFPFTLSLSCDHRASHVGSSGWHAPFLRICGYHNLSFKDS